MSKLNKIGAILASTVLIAVSLTACNNTSENAPARDTIVVKK